MISEHCDRGHDRTVTIPEIADHRRPRLHERGPGSSQSQGRGPGSESGGSRSWVGLGLLGSGLGLYYREG